jgi:hypothetical protein
MSDTEFESINDAYARIDENKANNEKDYITIKLCRDDLSGVHYVYLKFSTAAKHELDIHLKSDDETYGIHTIEGTFLFRNKEDFDSYAAAHPEAKGFHPSIKVLASPLTERRPLPGAISPMGIYENYYMPDGYKRLKDTL